MKKERDCTQLITKVFKEILHMDVRVLTPKNEDDLQYAIHIKDNLINDMTDDQLRELLADYGIFKSEFEKNKDKSYYYVIAWHDPGNFNNPPSSDWIESKEGYVSVDKALEALVMKIVEAQLNDQLMWWNYFQPQEEAAANGEYEG